MIKRLAPLVSLGLLLSCGSPTGVQPDFAYGEPFWLPVGEVAVSRDATTAVRFTRVIENSTCPIDVVCIWAGRLIVEVGVTVGTLPEERVPLELTDTAGRRRTVHGRSIEGVEFRPPNGGPPGTPTLRLIVEPVMMPLETH